MKRSYEYSEFAYRCIGVATVAFRQLGMCRRRYLQSCGSTTIGMRGAGDTDMVITQRRDEDAEGYSRQNG